MRALILVVNAGKKDVSSTAGMQETVKTSELFKRRVEVVPAMMKEMETAIQERDFETFARVTMKESNSFHATCLDTEPPIDYLNGVSWTAIKAVNAINKLAGRRVAAYTFDAGPNAVIYYLEKDSRLLAQRLGVCLEGKEGWTGGNEKGNDGAFGLGADYAHLEESLRNGVSRVIMTSVGEGPISVERHLIDNQGNPMSA